MTALFIILWREGFAPLQTTARHRKATIDTDNKTTIGLPERDQGHGIEDLCEYQTDRTIPLTTTKDPNPVRDHGGICNTPQCDCTASAPPSVTLETPMLETTKVHPRVADSTRDLPAKACSQEPSSAYVSAGTTRTFDENGANNTLIYCAALFLVAVTQLSWAVVHVPYPGRRILQVCVQVLRKFGAICSSGHRYRYDPTCAVA